MQIFDCFLRLGAAVLMGAVVGLERQWRQRMAGTRTNALVVAGASAFVMCAFMVRDTSRSEAQIVSYVVSGVGFLGAGVIFKDSGSVRGLNTAATLWCSAAIGAISRVGEPAARFDSHSNRAGHEHCSSSARVAPLSCSSIE
jgi:putative Mg2+ transporter-C (MgtC) family protein